MRTRSIVGAMGVIAGAWGAVLLLQLGFDNLVATAIWLGAGVVAHDAVWAPLVIAFAFIGARLVPPGTRATFTAALVVIGTVTVAAVPVLGRFGAREDNPTLLDRDYLAGWFAFVGAVIVGAVVAEVVRRTRRTP